MKRFIKCFLLYFLCIFFLEYVYKAAVFGSFISLDLLYTVPFTIIYALFFTILTIFLPEKLSYPVTLSLFIIVTFIFIGEFMFTYIYDTTFSVFSLNMANQAFDFRKILYSALLKCWFQILCFLTPLIIYIVFHKKFIYHEELKNITKYLGLFTGAYLIVLILISFSNKETYSLYNLYYKTHAPTITIKKLGLITEFRLDVSRYLFGFDPSIEIDDTEVNEEEEAREPDIKYNKLDLNFNIEENNSTISSINNYFESKEPTNQNDYTGIFKGKNIIYILAEGFNSIAVDENVTPTLYKMVNNSFVFTNYYSPVFMSTTGGEFQFSTGLIPTQKSLNEWKTGKTKFPYAIGNVFNELDYKTMAFHDWTYSYYKRNVTMPTLGFTDYTACGNGLQKSMNCKIWPPSDIEMMEATIDKYINEDKFAVHYITVSGHAEYNFFGNNMAMKNKKLVDQLEYSTPIKAYLATQIELDRALELLISKLEERGKLSDTAIVLSGDHYPYTLTKDQINEISTYERDMTFEVNHSNLIIYNSEIETTKVDKLATSIDVIPTVLNMFGIDFDSRILLGADIMSEHDSLVIFSNYSWITEKGRYNSATEVFTPNENVEVGEDYVSKINREVQNRVSVSTQIVSSNYYEKLLKNQSES